MCIKEWEYYEITHFVYNDTVMLKTYKVVNISFCEESILVAAIRMTLKQPMLTVYTAINLSS